MLEELQLPQPRLHLHFHIFKFEFSILLGVGVQASPFIRRHFGAATVGVASDGSAAPLLLLLLLLLVKKITHMCGFSTHCQRTEAAASGSRS